MFILHRFTVVQAAPISIVQHPGSLNIYFLSTCVLCCFPQVHLKRPTNKMQSNAFFFLLFFHKKTGISHKATKFSNSKTIFLHVKVYNYFFFLLAGRGWWCLFRIATKPMVYLGFKTAKKACHLKGGWLFSSISASMEKHREEATWLWWKGFTNLVDNECN